MVFAVIGVLAFLSSVGMGVRLLAGTLVAIGGNSNPTSAGMDQELGGNPLPPGTPNTTGQPLGVLGEGYLDPNNPNSPYYGWGFTRVNWPAQIPLTTDWDGTSGFEESQRQGLANLQAAMATALGTGNPVTVVGYSSSANVVVREMRYLQSIGSPDTDQLKFILIAGMNRPNGGLAQRFPGIFIPFFNVKFDGSTPTNTQYETLDISWEYDPVSDFPNYPLNFLADLNAALGFMLHVNYYPADLDGPRARPDYKDPNSNITYITLAAPHLPLLVPFRQAGVPKQFLDLIEPALKVLVDIGYDRSINPGTPTPASLGPTPLRLIALPFQLLNAIGIGIQHALNPSWDQTTTGDQTAITAAAANSLPQTSAKTVTLQTTADELTEKKPAEITSGTDENKKAAAAEPVIETVKATETLSEPVSGTTTPAAETPKTTEPPTVAPAPEPAPAPEAVESAATQTPDTEKPKASDDDGSQTTVRKTTPRHRASGTPKTEAAATDDTTTPAGVTEAGTGRHRAGDTPGGRHRAPDAGTDAQATGKPAADKDGATSGKPRHAAGENAGSGDKAA